jgi:phage terminase large subunit
MEQTQADTVTIQIPIEYKPLFDTWWRNALVEGGRYSLKSHTVGRYLLIRARMAKTRVLCGREFQNSIADSSHQLLADLIEKYELADFKVTRDSIVNSLTGSDFIFRGIKHNSQSIKSIEGVDIFWGEEAQAFSKDSIDIITPTIRKPGSQLIWTMNRTLELDPIYEILALNPRPDTLHLHINYDVAEKYSWVPKEILTEIEHDKEHNPEVYQHKWLGQPIAQTEQAILNRNMVMKAMQRDIEGDGAIEVGVDVARMGSDRSVFWKRKGLKTIGKETHTKLRLNVLADRLEEFVSHNKEILIKIDDTGVGGGLTDIMIERGYNIMAINFGGEPADKDKYPNWISEAWFYMQTILEEAELPMDSDLLMELTTRQWKQDAKGKRAVEGKADYKKRGYRSPDLADACIISYYTPAPIVVEWGGVR